MTERERLGPPPVEPMSDIAWSRVERGVWSRMDAGEGGASPASTERRRGAAVRWWIIAAPLAAAAILAVIVGVRLLLPAAGEEPVRIVSPKVAASEKFEPSSVTFEDSHIELDSDTALVTSHEGGHPHVLLERGAAWFTVSPRKSRPEFVVRAGDAMVRVIGTRFRVARAREQIAVEVGHGVVDVLFRGRVVEVSTGQRWSSASPASASVLAALPPTPAPVAAGPRDRDAVPRGARPGADRGRGRSRCGRRAVPGEGGRGVYRSAVVVGVAGECLRARSPAADPRAGSGGTARARARDRPRGAAATCAQARAQADHAAHRTARRCRRARACAGQRVRGERRSRARRVRAARRARAEVSRAGAERVSLAEQGDQPVGRGRDVCGRAARR